MSAFALSHGGLFAASFLAATVFYVQSELVLGGLLVAIGKTRRYAVLLAATLGWVA